MKKYRTLKFVNRYFLSRNFRCHKRRVFFENLFSPLKEVKDKTGDHVSGFIQYDESSFRRACHEMAAEVPFYPFEQSSNIYIGEFFGSTYPQTLYNVLRAGIVRTSSLWKVFIKYGEYEVKITGKDPYGKPINYKYSKKIDLP